MFVDKVKVFLKAGDGGNGIVSFRREKYVPAGGPDGGDGGKGGDIVFKVNGGMKTLSSFRYKKNYRAEPGQPGGSSQKTGRNGGNLIVSVPPGTLVMEDKTGMIIADLRMAGEEKIIARGGKGGKGNSRFKNSTRRAPDFANDGEPGEEIWVTVELKLIADVGLIGMPNVGKSTILSIVSDARPKIADYHFTTLEPGLGVVNIGQDTDFVVADIPGLIEGAHKGAGLGHDFLRHIERTRLLVHVVDISSQEGRDPLQDFELLNRELKLHSEKLAVKLQLVAANKMDIDGADDRFQGFAEEMKKRGYGVFPISAATGMGMDALVRHIAHTLAELPDEEPVRKDEYRVYTVEDRDRVDIRRENGSYIIEGPFVDRLMRHVNPGSLESTRYMQRMLRKHGVFHRMEEMGIENSDTVRIGEMEFEYFK